MKSKTTYPLPSLKGNPGATTGRTANLPKRPLGSSGIEITTVGFGAWALGGGDWAFSWGPQDDNASVATMRHALELGVNWIDTAATYGLGHSEEVVGRLLREMPASDRPLIFTKCGLVWDERNRMAEPRRVLKPESIQRECEASLRRLGVERIDLYQFHWPDAIGTPVEDSWGEMVRLVEQGKVRLAGVSNFDIPLLERCEAIRHVDSLQPPFSLIRRDAACAPDSLVRGAWHGRDLLQPHAVRIADRELQPRARRQVRARRLAAPLSRVSGAEPQPQSGVARCSSPDRTAARHHGICRRPGVDESLARHHRRDRRGSFTRAG